VSSTSKISSFYFTILNTDSSTYLFPDSKLVLALVLENIDVQEVLKLTLECLEKTHFHFDMIIADA
jgi:hypothetical protein